MYIENAQAIGRPKRVTTRMHMPVHDFFKSSVLWKNPSRLLIFIPLILTILPGLLTLPRLLLLTGLLFRIVPIPRPLFLILLILLIL